jgi:predicted RNase H-like HicB family nuclease
MDMICTVAITKEEDMYIAKDIQTGIADQGSTIEESISNLKEALELYYEGNDSATDSGRILYTTFLEVCV